MARTAGQCRSASARRDRTVKIRNEWADGKSGGFYLTGEFVELVPFSRIVHVERMHLPNPCPDNHVETRFEPDGSGTLMTMRMTLPDAQTR
jgi:Activator of Hsp90 ATPase homolog 1-like protein